MGFVKTTSEQALRIATLFVEENRPGAEIETLLEDRGSYGVQLRMKDNAPWPIGWAFIFISKQNGKLYEVAPGAGIDKISAMQPVG